MTEPELPLPEFDTRRMNRAVRRGLLRTAAVAAAIVLAGVLVINFGLSAAQLRGDRDQRMVTVLATAFQLAHPGYRISVQHCCDTGPLSLSFTARAEPLRAFGGFQAPGGTEYAITQNAFGRVGHVPMAWNAETTLTYNLYNMDNAGLQLKDDVKKVIAGLPQELGALAVVEFAKPLGPEALTAFLDETGQHADSMVYEYRPRSTPITWRGLPSGTYELDEPSPGRGYRIINNAQGVDMNLGGFRQWVRYLRDSDEPNLRAFGLDLTRLRKAAADGLAYAYITEGSSLASLGRLLDDPRVRTVRLADVAFNLSFPQG